MQSNAATPEAYLKTLPDDRREVLTKIRKILKAHLPKGFKEEMSYGMLSYVVPHAIYANGYHVNPKLPLPFINLASQKNYIALYHSAIYADEKLLKWFKEAYNKRALTKLDMGKSCIRFKNMQQIPYDLIAELAEKLTPQEWVSIYEASIPKAKKSD